MSDLDANLKAVQAAVRELLSPEQGARIRAGLPLELRLELALQEVSIAAFRSLFAGRQGELDAVLVESLERFAAQIRAQKSARANPIPS